MLSKDVCNLCRREQRIMELVKVPYKSLWNCMRTGELINETEDPPENCAHRFDHGVYTGMKSVNIDTKSKE